MLLQKPQLSKEQQRLQKKRCDRFAAAAAEAIGADTGCLFSILPHAERRRQATAWYEACSDAMLRGNYAPLDEWIRAQAGTASDERFELADLLKLLCICRKSAIEIDGWDEDIFSAVDDVINEGLVAIRSRVNWKIPEKLNYLHPPADAVAERDPANLPLAAGDEARDGERRGSWRNRLALPIRVRLQGEREEITRTENVSLRGVYFRSPLPYEVGHSLRITYPYWALPGGINCEYPARVARIDRLENGAIGVAVEFLQSLREGSI